MIYAKRRVKDKMHRDGDLVCWLAGYPESAYPFSLDLIRR